MPAQASTAPVSAVSAGAAATAAEAVRAATGAGAARSRSRAPPSSRPLAPSFLGIALCARDAMLVPNCGPRGADIGGGAGGRGGPGGSQAGTNGANGFGGLAAPGGGWRRSRTGAQGTNGNVRYGPGAPTAVSALAEDVSARVSFDAPADPGADAITSYTVTATDTTDANNGGQHTSGPAGPLTVEGLTTGDDYTFTVKATNGVGSGLASAPSSAVTAEDTATTTGLREQREPLGLWCERQLHRDRGPCARRRHRGVRDRRDGRDRLRGERRGRGQRRGRLRRRLAVGTHSVVATTAATRSTPARSPPRWTRS